MTITGRTLSRQLRIVIATVAVISAIAGFAPDWALIPFRRSLEASRDPHAVLQAVQWLCLTCGGLCVCLFAAWHRIELGIAAAVRSITTWSTATYWASVAASGFGLRLLLLVLAPPGPLISDSLWYHTTALAIADGQGLTLDGLPTAYRPPGYPALLALTYRMFGPGPASAWLWGSAATLVIGLATYRIAERLYGKPAARVATAIVAVYPALILYTAETMSDLVFTAGLTLVWSLLVLRPPCRWPDTLGIGVMLGLLTLTRSVAVALFAVVPLIWLTRNADLRKIFAHSILLTVVMAACLAPWIWRNDLVFGVPTLGTNLGLVLYIGNHPGASGAFEFDAVPASLLPTNPAVDEAAADRILLAAAVEFVTTHPLSTLAILPKKLFHLFALETTAAQILLQDQPFLIKYAAYGVSQILYMMVALYCFLRIMNIGKVGLPLGREEWSGLIIAVYFVLMAMIFFAGDRYRLPLLPWMIIEASVIIVQLGGARHAESR